MISITDPWVVEVVTTGSFSISSPGIVLSFFGSGLDWHRFIGRDATLHHGGHESKRWCFMASAWIDCSEVIEARVVENEGLLGEMWLEDCYSSGLSFWDYRGAAGCLVAEGKEEA